MTKLERSAEATEMRQLRHQTKNALQRVIAQVSASNLRATPAGFLLADEIERRICLSARVSDALFGLTACPGTLEQRLRSLASATVKLMADAEQTIETEVVVTGSCPEPLTSVIVRVAHEMLCNAVKHGMHMRLVGRITVRVRSNWDGSTTLLVSDDGWGPTGENEGEGLPIMRAMAQEHGGVVSISRVDNETVARLHLPIAV
jgi:two-component sensor histidine kinase